MGRATAVAFAYSNRHCSFDYSGRLPYYYREHDPLLRA
jgi:hypothetical protein